MNANSPDELDTPRVLDDAEIILQDARDSVHKIMEFIVADAIANRRLLNKKSLEIMLEGLTEGMAWEGDVIWANNVVQEHNSDASIYPNKGYCDELAARVTAAFREKSGDDFAASLFAALKPPSREQMESWRKPPTNPATTGRVVVSTGMGCQEITFINKGE